MQDTMDSETAGLNVLPGDDLSALAWVHGELRRSLETAHKALRRYLKDAETVSGSDLDTVDPSVLRGARTQLHQGVGALELVGLPAVADVLRASESAVQRMISKPAIINIAAVEVIERVSFALLDFLSRQLARKPVSPVMLFPQYRAALALAGADRVHPADLWKLDWQWLELPDDPAAAPCNADDDARNAMETEVLALMREPGRASLRRMSDLCADLGAGARALGSSHLGTLWQLAAAMFEAQATDLLGSDTYTKRIASRLLAQLRTSVRGQPGLSDRLAQDLLFFCGRAGAPAQPDAAPRLEAVRRAWRLQDHPVVDYDTVRLGRFDPAQLALARKRVAAAKDSWSAVAGGEQHRISGLGEQFALVGDSLQRLFPSGEVLAQALQTTVTQTVASGQSPPAALAMEVATGILYLDASLEDGELDQPELAGRVQRLARRIDEVRGGADPQPLDMWMEELYRRVSDRQTMGSVVQELRASLSEIEKQIDHYFRNPADRQVLIPVPAQLSSMRGVLSVLGMDQASQAALHMRDDVDALAQTEVDPQRAIQAGTFDRLADNLGALSFLIDMLSVQPQLAKSLFRFDPETGSLSAVMGQSERVSAFAQLDEEPAGGPPSAPQQAPLLDQMRALGMAAAQPSVSDTTLAHDAERLAQQALAADQPELGRLLARASAGLRDNADPAARRELRAELADAVAGLSGSVPEASTPLAVVPPPRPAPQGGTGLEDDPEMRDIFVEEAREVVADAGAAVERLHNAADNAQDMTTVRRAFHTLKGSSRMLGLRDFGDAAWSCEQLFNARLAQAPHMDVPLRVLTTEALAYMGSWVESIAEGRDGGHQSATVARAADALRLEGTRVAISLPAAPSLHVVDALEARAAVAAQAALAEAARVAAPAAPDTTVIMPRPVAAPTEVAAADTTVAWPRTAATPTPAEPVEEIAALPPLVAEPVWEAVPESVSESVSEPVSEPVSELLSAVEPEVLELPAWPELAADIDASISVIADFAPTEPAPAEDLAPASPAPDSESVTPAGIPSSTELELDFELLLPDFDDAFAPAPAQSLVQRVPELPSAADLDLSLPEPLAAPVVAEEESFELDLGDFNEPTVAAPAEPAAPPSETLDLLLDAPAPAAAVTPEAEALEIERAALDFDFSTPPVAQEPAADAVQEPVHALDDADGESDDQVKVIGPLRISIPLFNIYLNEADELSRRLVTELAEWAVEHERTPVSDNAVALAHSLAGNSATVGYTDLSALARALEHALDRSRLAGHGRPGEANLFSDAADEIRRLLHQFAAGFLRQVDPGLMDQLAAHERLPMESADAFAEPDQRVEPSHTGYISTPFAALPEVAADSAVVDDDIDAVDDIDTELFPIFEEEADELLPQLQNRLREWHDHPGNPGAPAACMRTLHTFKGGARLAGAMRLGEMAHRLESAVEHLSAQDGIQAVQLEPLLARADSMVVAFDALRRRGTGAVPALPAVPVADPPPAAVQVPALQAVLEPLEPIGIDFDIEAAAGAEAMASAAVEAAHEVEKTVEQTAGQEADQDSGQEADQKAASEPVPAVPLAAIDWARFGTVADPVAVADKPVVAPAAAAVRVRAVLLDRLLNNAGEVSITRSRIDSSVGLLQGSLVELTDSLERMRRQLRDIELQAETQISSRMEAAKAALQTFDPLEMDRFTRFQELTRFMAESVNDVATLQRSLQRTLQSAEDELAAQARLTRELQDDLLRTRMVEFESMADRLYRTVRQAAKDVAKQVRLDIVGGGIEMDRGVLERMAGSFEHLLRNSVAHGVETPAARTAAGKEAGGVITVTVAQSGNEVAVEVADDGAGLDLARIRRRGFDRGLLNPGAEPSDADLAQLIFAPGFSTAESVTELSGRGVGLDVVRAEVNAMGGRIETSSEAGKGTRFRLLLPLTTAVTQVVMLRCGDTQVAVPSPLVEIVRRVPTAEVESAYASGHMHYTGVDLPFFWMASLLQVGTRGPATGRNQSVVVIRSASQRVVVHVDEVVGNQEVVVKNVGPQLSRLPGLAGVTLLPSGAVALIYNPVALATAYADAARALAAAAPVPGALPAPVAAPAAERAPMVMVVDDSLTVRRVTQRMLVREGYRVVTAKDGLDALERLAEERPAVLLSDIEMPRMDGFDLVRNVRADPSLQGLPVVMITSRIAQKHRDYAAELGVDHYLGKPYSEEELLSLVARYVQAHAVH